MLFDLLTNGFTKEAIISVLLSVPAILFALTIHECSHGFAAKLMGDPTAYNLGRLTLNPAKHLDPIGTLMMLFVGFGWAKPVPINTRYFKKPKAGIVITSIAGPLSNIIAGYIFYVAAFLVLRFYNFPVTYFGFALSAFTAVDYLMYALYMLFAVAFTMNIGLALFNLLPIPPLDGSKILFSILPAKYYFKVMQYERYISLAVILLLVTGTLTVPLQKAMYFIEWVFNLTVSWMV